MIYALLFLTFSLAIGGSCASCISQPFLKTPVGRAIKLRDNHAHCVLAAAGRL